ncbi:MAG: acireductone dioxygenase, partial [Stenotrophomonas sp.]
MSRLRIYNDTAPDAPLLDSQDGALIAAELQRIGVTFERWQASQPVAPGASQ